MKQQDAENGDGAHPVDFRPVGDHGQTEVTAAGIVGATATFCGILNEYQTLAGVSVLVRVERPRAIKLSPTRDPSVYGGWSGGVNTPGFAAKQKGRHKCRP
jgi:hypothetical protein